MVDGGECVPRGIGLVQFAACGSGECDFVKWDITGIGIDAVRKKEFRIAALTDLLHTKQASAREPDLHRVSSAEAR